MELPSANEIAEVLQECWGIKGALVPVPSPNSRKVFRVETDELQYYVRWSFSRRDLSALQVVAFIDYVRKCGGAVPIIIPAKDGQLAQSVGDRCLSVEEALPTLSLLIFLIFLSPGC